MAHLARPVPVRTRIVSSMEDLIGDTPMLRLSFPELPATLRLVAKLEMFNPLSSVKDRAALHMLRAAEAAGLLPPARGTVIEATSGNTGISLAALCAVRGHRCILVLPDNATAERRLLLGAFGAEIVESPHEGGLPAAIVMAEGLHQSIPGSWLAHQDKNPDNVAAHYDRTGPEIWAACDGDVDVLVCTVGTGGTLTGIAHYLKERRNVHVVAVEPAASPVMSGGPPGPHRIPGIGGGFINDVTDMACIDEIVTVTNEEAAAATLDLATSAGLLAGISSGAAVHASRVVARDPRWADATIVTLLPDTGERYLSIWDTLRAEPAASAVR
jgi:cysteine synthase